MVNFQLFLAAIWADWMATMSTVGSIALILYGALVNAPVPRSMIFLAAIVCFVFASYRVWNRQFERAERLEAYLLDEYEAHIQQIQQVKLPRGEWSSAVEEEQFYLRNITGDGELIKKTLNRWRKRRAPNGVNVDRYKPLC